jgi:hypothetical protein
MDDDNISVIPKLKFEVIFDWIFMDDDSDSEYPIVNTEEDVEFIRMFSL